MPPENLLYSKRMNDGEGFDLMCPFGNWKYVCIKDSSVDDEEEEDVVENNISSAAEGQRHLPSDEELEPDIEDHAATKLQRIEAQSVDSLRYISKEHAPSSSILSSSKHPNNTPTSSP